MNFHLLSWLDLRHHYLWSAWLEALLVDQTNVLSLLCAHVLDKILGGVT